MRDWSLLLSDLYDLKTKNVFFSDYGSVSPGIKAEFLEYSSVFFNLLIGFIENSAIADDEKIQKIRDFFILHFRSISKSSVDYFLHPKLPMHLAALKIAQCIVLPHESVISILFPTVKKIMGMVPVDDLPFSCIDNKDFFFKDFILSSDGSALIYIQGIFEYAKENPDRLFAMHPSSPLAPYFYLSMEEFYQLKLVTGVAGRAYIDTLEKVYRSSHNQKASLGYELRKLKNALLLSSKIEKGSETTANDAVCNIPIAVFYDYWMRLSADIRQRIGLYKAEGLTHSLEDFLMALFIHAVSLNEEEIERVKNDGVMACTHQIGLHLESILANHPDLDAILFGDIPENADSDILPTKEDYKGLLFNIKHSLGNRIVSGLDVHVLDYFPLFSIMARDFYLYPNQDLIEESLSHLEPHIVGIHRVSTVLLFLPHQHWDSFFTTYGKKITAFVEKANHLQDERITEIEAAAGNDQAAFESAYNRLISAGLLDLNALAYFLKALPSESWVNLFSALKKNALFAPFLKSMTFSSLFYQLPKSDWPILRHAASTCLDELIPDVEEILKLWEVVSENNWHLMKLFQKRIEAVLTLPNNMAVFLTHVGEVEWDSALTTFSEIFERNLGSDQWVSIFFAEFLTNMQKQSVITFFQSDITYQFLKKILVRFPRWSFVEIDTFVDFLQELPTKLWKPLCQLLGKNFSERCLSTFENINKLLSLLSSSERRRITLESLAPFCKINKPLSPKLFETVLEKYPECERVLLQMSARMLYQLFLRYLDVFELFDEEQEKYPAKMLRRFYYLLDKALPTLMSLDYLQLSFTTEESIRLPDVAMQFVSALEDVDVKERSRNCGKLDAAYQKLGLFHNFFRRIDGLLLTKDTEELLAFSKKLSLRFNYMVARSLLSHIEKRCLSQTHCSIVTSTISTMVDSDTLARDLDGASTAVALLEGLRHRPSRSPTPSFFIRHRVGEPIQMQDFFPEGSEIDSVDGRESTVSL